MNTQTETKYLNDLFRREALDESRTHLGSPVSANGVSSWALTIFFLSLFIIAAGFACATRYAHKENVLGQVSPKAGTLRVVSSRSGMVQQVFVHEGQEVIAGQEMFAISFAPQLESGVSFVDRLKESQLNQTKAQERQADAKIDEIQHQIEEISVHRSGVESDMIKLKEAYALQESRVKIQEQNVAAAHTLGAQGMMGSVTVRGKEEDLISARQSLANLDREYQQQKNLSQQLVAQADRLRADARLARSDAENARAQMDEKRLNAEASYADHLVAPHDGIVTALQARQGGPISPNQTLAVVVPKGQGIGANGLEVELWAPSRAIGFVKPGAQVRIMYDAFPYQTFGTGHGTVQDVSSAPVMPNELPMPIDSKEQLFRIRVELDRSDLVAYGKTWPLSPGMRLSADLVLEERSLLNWLLDPLLATRKRAG